MADVDMPRLSDTMEQGTVAKWLKQEGERVGKGEPLVEIETDKANMVLESYESGVLEKIIVREGQTVPIGQPIAVISSERGVGGGPAQGAAPAKAPSQPAGPPSMETTTQKPERSIPEEETGERIKVSPIARRIAQEHDVDLRQIAGTGPGGRITKDDVEQILREQGDRRQVAPDIMQPVRALTRGQAGEKKPLTRMQATIAQRMTESKTTTPHFYVTNEVNMDAAIEFRGSLNAAIGEGANVGINDLLVKAAGLALRKFPDVNAFFSDEGLVYHETANVGIAVALPQGLVVPVLREVDRKPLPEVAREAKDLVQRTRSNRLAPSEWEDGTFTVSNLGMYDVLEFNAIITPPQSAIMAAASIYPLPVVVDGEIKVQSRVRLSLSADHRVFYGATAAEFLREVKRLLENPLSLLV